MTDYQDASDELTYLLPREDEEAATYLRTSEQNPDTRPLSTPLPKAQLGALIAVRIADPIAYQQIFPYVNQLLAELKVAEPEQVGFYSGLVVRVGFFDATYSVDNPPPWRMTLGERILPRPSVLSVPMG